jgi:outer membrane protein assembly factor BamA
VRPFPGIVSPFLFFILVNYSSYFINAVKACPPSYEQESIHEQVTVEDILITGNEITRLHVVMREIIFRKGDQMPLRVLYRAMERSRENLLNTSLFNFVHTHLQFDARDSSRVFVMFHLEERWYLWPLPVFEAVDRNFNEWWQTRDFFRTHYGAYITHDNFRGRKEKLSILVRLGYSQRIGLYYTIPYLNQSENNGLAFGLTYTRNREIAYGLEDSKLRFLKDPDQYVRHQTGAGLRYTCRHGIHHYYMIGLEFQNNRIADTVLYYNPDYFIRHRTTQKGFFLSMIFKRDYRDIKVYPLRGHYFDVEIVKQGFGIFEDEPELFIITSNYRKYWRLASRWHAAAGVKGKLSGKSFAPYYNQRGLGYGNDFVRGYEYYVVSGQSWLVFKSNLKFTLVPEKTVIVKAIPTAKFNKIPFAFYLNVFADTGYARDRQFQRTSPLSNQWLAGAGIGLDYVTYYDLVVRMEYTCNKFGDHGFFLHFTAPIF